MSILPDRLVNNPLIRKSVGLAARMKRGCPVILFYHGISVDAPSTYGDYANHVGGKHIPLDAFVAHLKTLKKSWRVISLSEMVTGLKNGDKMRGAAAITFDDGYENNFLRAAPALADFNMPASFFLTTNLIGKNELIWTDQVEALIYRANAQTLFFASNQQKYQLATIGEKAHAVRQIKTVLKSIPNAARLAAIDQLSFDIGNNDFIPPTGNQRLMSWDQARSLSQSGFEIGGHTMTHPILSRMSLIEAKQEILGCQDRVKAELGKCSPVFCYPNGKSSDYTQDIMSFCNEHFDAAVSTNHGAAAAHEIFELCRLASPAGARIANIDWMLFSAR